MYRILLDAGTNVNNDTNTRFPDATFMQALCDDLNTPQALARLHALRKARQTQTLLASARQLGLLYADPQTWFQQSATSTIGLSTASIEALIVQREEARRKRNYATADQIRKKLETAGIHLEDQPGKQTVWCRK